MDLKQYLIGGAASLIVGAVCAIIAKKRGKTVALGLKHGIILSAIERGLINKGLGFIPLAGPAMIKLALKIENAIENTWIDYTSGINLGLRSDNKDPKIKAKIEKLKAADNKDISKVEGSIEKLKAI